MPIRLLLTHRIGGYIMKKDKKRLVVPEIKLNSDYFKCPRCGWEYPGPLLVLGNIAEHECEKCGNSYLVRID